MVRQARAELTREGILRGAAAVFDRYGYGSTTLSDVVAHSGVTKGALYFHFTSKEDLAKAVIDKYQSSLAEPWRRVLEPEGGGALESLVRLSQHFADLLVDDVVVRAGVRLTLEQGTFGTLSSDSYQGWLQVVQALLHRAAEQGDVRSAIDAPSLARFLVASFTGVQMLSQVLSGRTDLQRRVHDMWEIVLPSLVPADRLPRLLEIAEAGGRTGVGRSAPDPGRSAAAVDAR